MTIEHVILIAVAIVGFIQTGNLFLMVNGLGKIKKICLQMNDLQKQLGTKVEIGSMEREQDKSDDLHEKIDLALVKIGKKIVKLEMVIIPKIHDE